ncbi:DUF1501 domain-containing protein [Singulisphaera acidiphila]|uniref:Arylsulfatase A family protein n=1 Tax=Singulisphaera acidiphila (strain ATCC BAA-1392 / DSM 18658 / VKM B-2454 / MOB10) TaxID=886293 RepID=L0DCU1_SINAD|nr:DUF1501 domain-containing protein [Singulisphaera acidiphila]AGA27062.1 arylsulfatase A family protein [Singulisphaera acidiphila DSM 18658]
MDRREFFSWVRNGLGGAALADLMLREGRLQAAVPGESASHCPHFAPKATRAIHICLVGALSQVDSFDYKPGLIRAHGQSLPSNERPDVFFGQVGRLRRPDWEFRQRGQSGLWVSELFPEIATVADELTVIHSMFAETSNHTPATFQQNSGFRLNGFPTLGAWISYGLGSEADDLPAFVVIPDARERPPGGTINWTNGFLPARHQGVVIRSNGPPIDDLFPARSIAPDADTAARDLAAAMNHQHLRDHDNDDVLTARVRGYELAARMQMAVPEVANLHGEPAKTQALYGLDRPETADFGRSCLIARRLLERGVRFVQLFSGGTFGSPRRNWDGHEDMKQNHSQEALRIDRPVAALIQDLRRRGLLDDTLVLFTTEFGRTPFTQSASDVVGKGRDHNQNGFSVWMAGAGLKHGFAYGSTDDIGWKAVENPVHWHDFHATVLQLLGVDHEQLTYYHNGIQRRLTNVHGNVIRGILA